MLFKYRYLFWLLAFLSISACFSSENNKPSPFGLPVTYPVGGKPSDLVAKDMNNDRYPDLLIPNTGENTLHFYEGIGDGTFKKAVVLETGREPIALAVADFDGDGLPDIALCNYGDSNLSIILGQKDGLFKFSEKVKTGRLPIAIDTADFNNDGFIDLAVTLRFNKLMIFLGIGDGTFKIGEVYKATGTPADLVVGNFNNDKNPDISIASNAVKANYIKLFYGNGDGTFQNPQKIIGGGQSNFITKYDVNDDNIQDLLTINPLADSVTLFIGQKEGGFSVQPNLAGEKGPQYVVSNEFTGDRAIDLVISNRRDNSISILEGRGDGSFVFPHYNYPVGPDPRAMAAADFNNDGLTDLAIILHQRKLVEILMRSQGTPDPIE